MTNAQGQIPTDRYHALDSLRGFAMFLGIVLHAAISFMSTPLAFWPVHDRNPDKLTNLFLFAVHDFRMQTFFLLAGFFGCLLYKRYGIAGTAWHRTKRVALPFVLSVVFIIPTVMAAFLYAELENVRTEGAPENATEARRAVAEMIEQNPGASNTAIIIERFTSGDFIPHVPLAHLWFLYYLLFFYAAVLLLAPLLKRLEGSAFLAKLDSAFRWLVESRLRVFVPALLTLPVLLCMKTPMADTPLGWTPAPQIFGYYFVFFVFGWMLYRQRDLVLSFGRGWKWNLAIANLVVLPVTLGLTLQVVEHMKAAEHLKNETPIPFALRLGAFAAQSLYTWFMIVSLWGAFLHFFAHASAWTRYLADASYWCYLASITPIVVLQFVVKDWPLPGLVKWVMVTTATMAILLASYEWCVRYTFIGAILNGRKYRAKVGQASSLSDARPAGSLPEVVSSLSKQ
jgi:peptidoglycan/LPS O-acetylase OafA/YrhL